MLRRFMEALEIPKDTQEDCTVNVVSVACFVVCICQCVAVVAIPMYFRSTCCLRVQSASGSL